MPSFTTRTHEHFRTKCPAKLNPSIVTKLNSLVILAVVSQIIVAVYQLYQFRTAIWEQRQAALKDLAATALSAVAAEYALFKDGKQTEDAARELGKAAASPSCVTGTTNTFFISDLERADGDAPDPS